MLARVSIKVDSGTRHSNTPAASAASMRPSLHHASKQAWYLCQPAGRHCTAHGQQAARSSLSDLNDMQAMWAATNDAEQAVSTLAAGPRRPNTYARRPEATLGDAAVKENEVMPMPCWWARVS